MQVTTLSGERKKYLRVVQTGVDNALVAIYKNDYEQAYRELTHIHHLPLLILHFKDFDKEFYQLAFLDVYLRHSAPEYKEKIEEVLHNYQSDHTFITVDHTLIEQLQKVYKDISIARSKLSHVLIEYPAEVAECLRESHSIIHKIFDNA